MFDDDRPIYLQIADRIRTDILSGDLGPDDRVMSTNEIAQEFRINPATAAKGINLLVDDGILYKRRGVGMFVHDDARAVLRRRRREAFFSERVDPVVAEARLLDVPLDDVIARIRSTLPDPAPTPEPTSSPS